MSISQPVGLWGSLSKREFEESVTTLERAIAGYGGDPVTIFNCIRRCGTFTDRIAKFITNGAYEESRSQRLTREVLGNNFFGVKEWASRYDAYLTTKQLFDTAHFPWNKDVLNAHCPFVKGKSVKETHFAFLGLASWNGQPMNILRLKELHPYNKQPCLSNNQLEAWRSHEASFRSTTLELRWYLLLKDIVPDSERKTFDEQKAMLPEEYEVPSAVEEVTKDLLVFKIRSLANRLMSNSPYSALFCPACSDWTILRPISQ